MQNWLLGEATLATLMFIGNQIFMKYLGDNGVGAFGIACYYIPFVFMVGNAIAQSAQPILSYNYGMNLCRACLADRETGTENSLVERHGGDGNILFLPTLACGAIPAT